MDLAKLRGITALLVEDDAMTRQALMHTLQIAGMKILEADSAESAMVIFQRIRPDVILSDIGLPEKDGYALLREIRRLETDQGASSVPAIAFTAFARELDRDRDRAIEAVFQAYSPTTGIAGGMRKAP